MKESYIGLDEKLHLSPNIYIYINEQDNNVYINLKGEEKKIGSLSNGKIQISQEAFSFEDKILIFEDWVRGWFLDILKLLVDEERINFQTGFIILISSLPYIEMMAQIEKRENSKGKSKRFFTEKFKKIFKAYRFEDKIILSKTCLDFEKYEESEKLNKIIREQIYDKIRNGLMHNFMIKEGVKFSYDYKFAFEIYEEEGNNEENKKENKFIIKINPKKFVYALIEDFEEYLYKLRNSQQDSNIRKNFKDKLFELHGKLQTINPSGAERKK